MANSIPTNPTHFPGTQEQIVFRVSGTDGMVTPWTTSAETEHAANVFCAEVNAAAGEYFTDVFQNYVRPGLLFSVTWEERFLDTNPPAIPPEGTQLEDIANQWFPPPDNAPRKVDSLLSTSEKRRHTTKKVSR